MKFLPIICTEEYSAVIEYRGQKYYVEIDILYDNNSAPGKCNILFERTLDKELSVSKANYFRGNFVKWGGCPIFRQGECWPATDEGIPYDYLCTVDNKWGDMGNCNIFILTKKVECDVITDNHHYEIVDVYMEASCC